MTGTPNGFELLLAICQHADIFSSIQAEANKTAVTLLKKHIKTNSLTIEDFRATRSAIGANIFMTILDDLSETELRALVKKVDQHCPDLDAIDERSLRRSLRALAASELQPWPKPRTAPGKVKSPAPKDEAAAPAKAKGGAHWPVSMAAKPSRRRAW